MGLDTICTYVFWNLHEPRAGCYDFAEQNDVARYIRTAQEEGLSVLLRPGPYVCAEWDFGGFPAWLLADPAACVRSRDPVFMAAARRWLARLGQELGPLLTTRGGPIAGVQIENEYGSFGDDRRYMEEIRDAIVASGLGAVPLYTADGPDVLRAGTLPGIRAMVNFGPGNANSALAKLRAFRPAEPVACGEYWAGWFDHWGEPHQVTDAAVQVRELRTMRSAGVSLNIYMFHGGTNFGFNNGANSDAARPYEPTTTSYDYDAALDEAGRPRAKYFAFRDVAIALGAKPPPVPLAPRTVAIATFALDAQAPLWSHLPPPARAERPAPMERFGQSYGYVLYRTRVFGPRRAVLAIGKPRDYALVFVGGACVGTLDRRLGEGELTTSFPEGGATLDVLVENCGRVNFGESLIAECKGLLSDVTLGGDVLRGWSIYTLPMEDLSDLAFTSGAASGPAFHRGYFEIAQPADTFLDVRNLHKGVLWLNGRNLGRFWRLGPQQSLYAPGAWMRAGRNEVIAFDLFANASPVLQGLSEPCYELHR